MKKYNKPVFILAFAAWGLFSAVLFLIEYEYAACWKSLAQGLNFAAYISCSFTINICKMLGIFDLKYNNYRLFCTLFLLCQAIIYVLGGYLILKLLAVYDAYKKLDSA